jgi:hypothetical protein
VAWSSAQSDIPALVEYGRIVNRRACEVRNDADAVCRRSFNASHLDQVRLNYHAEAALEIAGIDSAIAPLHRKKVAVTRWMN